MAIMTVEGMVISESLYGESSKILKIFTRDLGIISVLSKGCRKPKSNFRISSSPLVHANFDINYKEGKISSLIGVSVINYFKNIILDYTDISKKTYSFFTISLINQVLNQKGIEKSEIESIYDLLVSTINKINGGVNPSILLDIVRLKLLDFLGVKPSLDSCSNCGSTSSIITFSSEKFGYVCSNCYQNELLVNKESIKMIRMLYYCDIARIKKLELTVEEENDIHNFLNQYYEEHTGIYLKIDDKIKMMTKVEKAIC